MLGNSSANKQADAEKYAADKAAATARLGFDYLTNPQTGVGSYITNGTGANNAESSLLGIGGDPTAQNAAFKNYLNSTGYNFQLGQGTDAITSSQAARGLLHSGSTLKSLDTFGQGLAQSAFQNYFNNLQGVSGQGLSAAGTIGGAGSQAGASGAAAIASGYGNAAQTAAGGANQLYNGLGYATQGLYNYFNQPSAPSGNTPDNAVFNAGYAGGW